MAVGHANWTPRHYIFATGGVHVTFFRRHQKRNSCRSAETASAHLIVFMNDRFQRAVMAQINCRLRGTTAAGQMSIRYPRNGGRLLKRECFETGLLIADAATSACAVGADIIDSSIGER